MLSDFVFLTAQIGLLYIATANAVKTVRLVLATNPTFPKSRVCVLTDMAAAISSKESNGGSSTGQSVNQPMT
jgi:hypothetical protein